MKDPRDMDASDILFEILELKAAENSNDYGGGLTCFGRERLEVLVNEFDARLPRRRE